VSSSRPGPAGDGRFAGGLTGRPPAPGWTPTGRPDAAAGMSTLLRGERRGGGPGRSARLFVARYRRLIAAMCVAVAVAAAVRALAPPPVPTQVVLVAARDLPAGKTLVERDLRTARWSAGTVPEGALPVAEGRVLASPLRAGEPVTDVRVVGPGLLAEQPAWTVAAAVRVADPAAARLVRAGDRVDVFAASSTDIGGYPLDQDPEGAGGRSGGGRPADGDGVGGDDPGGCRSGESGSGSGGVPDDRAGSDPRVGPGDEPGGSPGGGTGAGSGSATELGPERETAGEAGPDAGRGASADVIAADVLVLAASGAGSPEGSGGGGFGGLTSPLQPADDGSGAGLLVLGVDRATAARLADAQGSRPLSIAIRRGT
jgi:hypothetical protein